MLFKLKNGLSVKIWIPLVKKLRRIKTFNDLVFFAFMVCAFNEVINLHCLYLKIYLEFFNQLKMSDCNDMQMMKVYKISSTCKNLGRHSAMLLNLQK